MTDQETKYWAELRWDRLMRKYLEACYAIKDFQYSSVGIAMVEKMNNLRIVFDPTTTPCQLMTQHGADTTTITPPSQL